jgi:hypothetical protein
MTTLSTGRRLFALRQVRNLAKEVGFDALVTHAAAAIKHDKHTHELDLQWVAVPGAAMGAKPTKKQAEVKRIDVLVDRTLTALRDAAVAQLQGAKPGDGIAEQVDSLLNAIFPTGVQDVTSLSFVEELAAVDAIVDKLKGMFASTVDELGLTRLAKRLAELAIEYRAAQEAPAEEELSFGTVRAARNKGPQHLLQAVALIVGRYYKETDEHLSKRAKLLAPVLKQNEAVALYLRARRAVEDVDPETGEVDPSAPPSGEPVPARGV